VSVIARYHLMLPFFPDVQYTMDTDRYGIF